MRTLPTLAVGAALLASLTACSGAATSAPSTPPSPVAAKPSTPQSCLDALDRAEQTIEHAKTGFGHMAEMADASSDGFTAAAEAVGLADTQAQIDALDRASKRIQVVNGKLNALAPKVGEAVQAYNSAAAKCRASVE